MPMREHLRDLSHLLRVFRGTFVPKAPAPYLSDAVQFTFPAVGEWIPQVAAQDPVAGANFIWTVPETEDWLILSLATNLNTDATVVSRIMELQASLGGNIFNRQIALNSQAASLNWRYIYSPWYAYAAKTSIVWQYEIGPLPLLVLPRGAVFESVVNNLQAGDNIGATCLLYLRRFAARE